MYNDKVIMKVPIVCLIIVGNKYEYLCIIMAEHSGRSIIMLKSVIEIRVVQTF